MKVRIYIFISLVLIALCGLLYQPAKSHLVHWVLHDFCQKRLNGELSHQQFYQDGDVWILENPQVCSKVLLNEGGHCLAAEKAKLKIQIDWFERFLYLDLEILNPKIEIGPGASELKALIAKPCSERGLFKPIYHVTIPQGEMAFLEEKGGENVNFKLDIASQPELKAEFAAWFDPKSRMKASIFMNPEACMQIDVHADHFDMANLMQVFSKIWPTEFQITRGFLNGNISLLKHNEWTPLENGELFLSNLCFEHSLYKIRGELPEARLFLNGKKDAATIGHLELTKKGTITLLKEGNPFWQFSDFRGNIFFKDQEGAKLSLEALCQHDQKNCIASLDGNLHLSADSQTSLNLGLKIKEVEGDNLFAVNFFARQLGALWNFGELEVTNFRAEEFRFLQALFGDLYPEWNQIQMHRGAVDASLLVYMNDFVVYDLSVEKFSATELKANLDPWGISLDVKEASASCSLRLDQLNVLDSLNVDARIANGSVDFGGPWNFVEIYSDFVIRRGVIQNTLLSAEIAGLSGAIVLDWSSPEQVVQFDFSGGARGLSKLLPVSFEKGITTNFINDKLEIFGSAKRAPGGICVNGKINLSGPTETAHNIPFGFDLMLPREPRQLILTLIKVKNGWFDAKEIPLKKYLSPFVFKNEKLSLSGVGDFHGTYTSEGAEVHYDAQNLVVESDDLSLEVKRLSTGEVALPAVHFFDFEKQESFGSIPVTNATYFEKHNGLLFTDINALVNLESGHLRIPEIETFSNGIYFSGSINVDWNLQGEEYVDVTIHADNMSGKFSEVQQFFSHFKKPIFAFKPGLEGQVAFRQQGCLLSLYFSHGTCEVDTQIQGVFSDGVIAFEGTDIALQELSLNFDFDHKGNTLEFSDIQGAVLVGKPGHVEEYSLVSDRIKFRDFANLQSDFDIWVADKKRDLIRITGKTVPVSLPGKDSPGIEFKLDHALTHFGNVHPSTFQLTLKNEGLQIDSFHMDVSFELETLLRDLQRFSRTGLFFLSRHLLKGLNDLEAAQGLFNLTFDYNDEQSLFTYHATGENVAVDKYNFSKCLLNGRKKNSTWMVDQLQFDDISLAADFLKDESKWKVNFLGLRFGEALLVGLDGIYHTDENQFDAQINLLESNIGKLAEWPSLSKLLEPYRPAGFVRGAGKMRLDFQKGRTKVDATITCGLRSGEFKGLYFEDIENCTCKFSSEHGVTVEGIQTAVVSGKDHTMRAAAEFDKIEYRKSSHELAIEGLKFEVPVQNLRWLSENLQQSFPDAFNHDVAEIFCKSKREGVLRGSLNIALSNPHYFVRLSLEDDSYYFQNKEYQLKSFVLENDPFGISIISQYLLQQQYVWLQIKSAVPKFEGGELIVLDQHPLTPQVYPPLVIHWQNDHLHGFVIQKIEGKALGLNMQLARDTTVPLTRLAHHLVGTIKVDFSQFSRLLKPELAKQIAEWEIGKGYLLRGKWVIGKDEKKDLMDQFAFSGMFEGQNCEFQGYVFQKLHSLVEMDPSKITVKEASLMSPCGQINIKDASIVKEGKEDWLLHVPTIHVQNFRPSLLHDLGSPPPKVAKPLVINQILLHDLRGKLGNKNSFTGIGELTFANKPKKNIHHPLFAIPAEILTRIGLDLSVLNPVTGTIQYEIHDAKIVMTRFKDIFSDGKLSKFYLPNTAHESFMDFKGNLHVQVKMKQYNLIFKLAELFTVTIQGNVRKPTYTLQKQNRQSKNLQEIAADK